jgi:uncharacterized membrane protein
MKRLIPLFAILALAGCGSTAWVTDALNSATGMNDVERMHEVLGVAEMNAADQARVEDAAAFTDCREILEVRLSEQADE